MNAEDIKSNEQRKNSTEKDINLNNDMMEKYIQESPHSDNNNNEEEEKPIHFKEEYDKNQYYENQIESSPEKNNNIKSQSKSQSDQKEQQEFIIENNNQINEKEKNEENNPDFYQENNDNQNAQNSQQQYYNLLKQNNIENNKQDNLNNYYYYYLNNYNNKSLKTSSEDETTSKKVVNFANKTYQGRIDPVHLNKAYNNFWKKQNKNKNKYKEKLEALQKVFHPNGYNSITGKFKRKGMSQSRYSSSISVNNIDRPPFDNTKAPLPKQSYLLVPYDYGINDPNFGKEDPANYDRKKMVKLRMVKQPLRYYYPYTVENFRKRNFKYE
jgi:hypothetical protein